MTSRTPMVGGNWKMHTTRAEARTLLGALREALAAPAGVEVVICPPYPWLGDACDALAGSGLRVGAQDLHWEARGAFTGAVSGPMLAGVAEYVIVGHSERRHVFGETREETRRKLGAALAAGLSPILAVGETAAEADAGRAEEVLRGQLLDAFEGLPELGPAVVVAYEPVWAIGTGRAATPEDAQSRCAFVRGVVRERFGAAPADALRVQYGGSVNPDNIDGFAVQPDVDGALVGGASLDADAFAAICRAVAAARS